MAKECVIAKQKREAWMWPILTEAIGKKWLTSRIKKFPLRLCRKHP